MKQLAPTPAKAPAAPTCSATSIWRGALFTLLLTAAVALAYQPVWHAGFVWDDDTHLLNNPVLEPGGLARTWLARAATPGEPHLNYWPLTFTVYWLEYQAWSLDSTCFHLVNVALHILAALLVWRVLRRLGLRDRSAMIAATIFALHPVAVEAVAWVTQTKTLLPTVLALLATLFYLGYDQRRKPWQYALALMAFALSTLARGMAVTLPVVLLTIIWWQRRRISRRDVLRVLPFFAIGVAMAVVETVMQQQVAQGEVVRNDGPVVRALAAGWAAWFYLVKLLCPMNLSFVYPRWNVSPAHPLDYLPALLLLTVLGAAWAWRRSWGRPVLAASICYLALLLPALGFVNVYFMKYSLVADHYQYMAMIVPITAAAALIDHAIEAIGGYVWRGLAGVGVAAVLALLAVLTFNQTRPYRDEPTLWRDVLTKDPDCWLAHNQLGRYELAQGDATAAIPHFRRALALDPDRAFIYHDLLGTAQLAAGHPDQALPDLEAAVATKEHAQDPDTNYNLGIAYLELGQTDRALPAFDRALLLHLDSHKALLLHVKLGAMLQDQRQYARAIPHLEEAIRLARAEGQTALAADMQNALNACRAATGR